VLFRAHRLEGTVRAYRGHAVSADPFAAPGAEDLTAHVDFSLLRAAAEEAERKGWPALKGSSIEAALAGVLTAERTALNFLQRLSGIATLTAAFAAQARGTRARILDTRKTIPGWRALEKYAVRCGGGVNHRMGLYDAVMVKDNHWLRPQAFAAAVRRLRRLHPRMSLIMEADEMTQVRRALELGADVVMLDNMPPPRLRQAIAFIRKSSRATQIEVSGRVDIKSVRALARLGPDRISIGRITHSAPALDVGLDLA